MITEHVTALLQTLGHGTIGTDLFADHMPPKPDDAVAVITSGGLDPTYVQESAEIDTEQPTFQVTARSGSLVTAKTKIHAVYNSLQAYNKNGMINGVRFLRLRPLQTPFPVRRDENDRWEWAVNFFAEKEVG